jgi:hypothetical protein
VTPLSLVKSNISEEALPLFFRVEEFSQNVVFLMLNQVIFVVKGDKVKVYLVKQYSMKTYGGVEA